MSLWNERKFAFERKVATLRQAMSAPISVNARRRPQGDSTHAGRLPNDRGPSEKKSAVMAHALKAGQ